MEFIDSIDGSTTKWVRNRYQAEAQELRDHPGKWAAIRTDAPNQWLAKHVSRAQLAAFSPAGAYQGSFRSNEDGTFTIYARYLGAEGVDRTNARRRNCAAREA